MLRRRALRACTGEPQAGVHGRPDTYLPRRRVRRRGPADTYLPQSPSSLSYLPPICTKSSKVRRAPGAALCLPFVASLLRSSRQIRASLHMFDRARALETRAAAACHLTCGVLMRCDEYAQHIVPSMLHTCGRMALSSMRMNHAHLTRHTDCRVTPRAPRLLLMLSAFRSIGARCKRR